MPSIELQTALTMAQRGLLRPLVIRGSHLDLFEPVLLARVHQGSRVDPPPLAVFNGEDCQEPQGLPEIFQYSNQPTTLVLNAHRLSPKLLDAIWAGLERSQRNFPLILHLDPEQQPTSQTRLSKLEESCSHSVCRLSPLGKLDSSSSAGSPRAADIVFLSLQQIYLLWRDLDPLQLGLLEHISAAAKTQIDRPPLLSARTQQILLDYNWPLGSSELLNVIDAALQQFIAERSADFEATRFALRVSPAAVHLADGTQLNPILCAPPTFIEPRHLPKGLIVRPIADDSLFEYAFESRLTPQDLWHRYTLYANQRTFNKTLLSQYWDVPISTVSRWITRAREAIQSRALAHDSVHPPLANKQLKDDSTRPLPPDCGNIETAKAVGNVPQTLVGTQGLSLPREEEAPKAPRSKSRKAP